MTTAIAGRRSLARQKTNGRNGSVHSAGSARRGARIRDVGVQDVAEIDGDTALVLLSVAFVNPEVRELYASVMEVDDGVRSDMGALRLRDATRSAAVPRGLARWICATEPVRTRSHASRCSAGRVRDLRGALRDGITGRALQGDQSNTSYVLDGQWTLKRCCGSCKKRACTQRWKSSSF